jgi:hypothetical protein
MDIIAKIELALKKKKEEVVLDLYLKDYERSNFYFALVYNKKIQKFKILFVPLDAIDDMSKISEYFCYQFILLNQVEYILSTLNTNKNLYKDNSFRDRKTIGFDSYYVELNYYDDIIYTFKFSQYIDKDFLFLFDIIAVFFEYLPHIVSELCMKLLQDFDNKSISIKYNNSITFDLFYDNLDCFEKCDLSYDDIKYIEKIGNKYYIIIFDKLVVFEYVRSKKLLNIFSSFDLYGMEHLIIINAIRDEIEKYYSRILYDDIIFICYGFSNGKFKIIGHDDISISDGIRFDIIDDSLKNDIKVYCDNNGKKGLFKKIFEEK